MKAFLSVAALALVSLFFCAVSASAHSVGVTMDKAVGDYLMEAGFYTTELRTGVQVYSDYLLISPPNSPDWDFVKYDTVHLTIRRAQSAEVVHEVDLEGKDGTAIMLYTLPKPGDYILALAFHQNDKTIVEGEFPITITSGGPLSLWTVVGMVGVVLMMVVGVALLIVTLRVRPR